MDKQQFLAAIRLRLSGLPQEDIEKSLEFYRECIEDRMEEGLSEEEAVAAMGPVDEIVSQILMDTSLPKLVKARMRSDRALRAWEIVLLVLGFPLWFTLLATAASLVLSLYIVLWAVVLSLYAVDFALALSGACGILGGVYLLFWPHFAAALFLIGGGLALVGLSILLFVALSPVAKGTLWLSAAILRGLKSLVIRKGDAS